MPVQDPREPSGDGVEVGQTQDRLVSQQAEAVVLGALIQGDKAIAEMRQDIA